MLTAKENMREVVRGGNPDRFVNQYEAVALLMHPFLLSQPLLQRGEENVVNAWGVTNSFPANTPGAFPVHTPEKIVVKDIESWRDTRWTAPRPIRRPSWPPVCSSSAIICAPWRRR